MATTEEGEKLSETMRKRVEGERERKRGRERELERGREGERGRERKREREKRGSEKRQNIYSWQENVLIILTLDSVIFDYYSEIEVV